MNIDMRALLRDHGVAIADAGDKHTSPGWLNIDCPFCGDTKKHLGWNISGQYWNCWKCAGHRTDDVLAELLAMPYYELDAVKRRYAMRPSAALDELETGDNRVFIRPAEVVVPGGELLGMHWDYLLARGYDPERVSATWDLRGTGPLAKGHAKFRIMCPIYHGGRVVSWQGRDVTGRAELRWYSCPAELEARAHKHCLGGEQLVPGNSVAVVEGFTDAWRLGPGTVCTFGTDYLAEQVSLLRKYRRRFVVLDSRNKDPNAAQQADRLANMLSAFAGETVIAELDTGDPGDMAQADADYLMEKEWQVR